MTLLERGMAGSVLILAVALLRAAAGRALPRRTFAVLWWVAALRLLLPWEISSRFSIYTLCLPLRPLHPSAAAIPMGEHGVAVQVIPSGEVPAAGGFAMPVETVPAVSAWWLVWIAGTLVLMGWFTASYLRCREKVRESLPVENSVVSCWIREHPGVSVRVSDQVSTPMAYGIFRPVFLLPKEMDWGNEAALIHILTHEYVHIRCLDSCAKLVFAGALCVHWWNPAVWLMVILANRDLELACDAAVVRQLRDPAGYARTLLRMEEVRTGLILQFAQSPIEERVKAMMKLKSGPISALAAACGVLLVVCVTTAFATSARQAVPELADQLAESITCEEGVLSFTIPQEDAKWDLWIAGRMQAGGMTMSVHYLEEESETRSWEPGRSYRFWLAEAVYDELTINGTNGRENVDIDLLPYLPRPAEEGVSAAAEAAWAQTLAPYLPLGLEYTFDDPDCDGNGLRMTFQGREVRGIVDGDTWITEHVGNSLFDEHAGEVRAVYESGVLTGLDFLSEEEQADFTARRESARKSMIWPVINFKSISSAFGPRANPGGQSVTVHDGIDVAASAGTDVFVVLDGTVTEAGYDSSLGNHVLVSHGNGLETLYAHCQELCVETGDTVEQGQIIAKVGSTGQSTGAHLHFEIRQDGEPKNPLDWVYGYGLEIFESQKQQ